MSVKPKKSFDITRYSAVMASLISIVFGLIIAFIILMATKPDTGLNGFTALVTGGMTYGALRNLGNTLFYATPILCTGVGMCLAFQAGNFNIGGPGQFTAGSFAAIMVALKVGDKVPAPLSWIIPLIAAFIAGALWALIPGILKAFFNVNIVIATIMFNYIAMYYVVYLVREFCPDTARGQSMAVPKNARLPKGFFEKLTNGSSADIGFIIAILVAVAVWVLLNKTKLGYELKACGKNVDASTYAGIQARKNVVISILLSGAICGLGGGINHLAKAGVYIKYTEANAAEGFTGIAVACLASNNPLGAIFGALYLAFLTVGGTYMQLFGFQKEIVSVITSVIVYFAAFSLFMKQFIERKLTAHHKELSTAAAGGQK